MASTTMHLLHVITLPKLLNTHQAHSLSHPKPTPLSATRNRRQCILLLTATTFAVKSLELPAKAEDIGLFGIRKRIQKAEEEVEEVVKEGIENAEKGFEKAEKGFENAEKGFEKVEKEVVREAETGFGFGGLVQGGAVAGAEVVGVLVATSVVNGILGPEGQNS